MVSSIYNSDPPQKSDIRQNVEVKSNGSEIFVVVCLILVTLFSSCDGRSNYSHFLKAAYDYDTKDPANK